MPMEADLDRTIAVELLLVCVCAGISCRLSISYLSIEVGQSTLILGLPRVTRPFRDS